MIYVGDGSSVTLKVADMVPNRPNYYRIWNVKNGVVSSSGTDAFVVPEATLPYEPELETWQTGLVPASWDSSSRTTVSHRLTVTVTNNRHSVRGASTRLPPLLPPPDVFSKPSTLRFEFSSRQCVMPKRCSRMTPRTPAGGGDGPVVILPKGYEPGWFGKVEGAGLHVKVGPTGTETLLESITEYNGTMTEFNEDMCIRKAVPHSSPWKSRFPRRPSGQGFLSPS